MNTLYRLMSSLMLGGPLLWVWGQWHQLPTRLPVHFGPDHQPDRFASRPEWLSMLLSVLFILVLLRSGALALLGKRMSLREQDARYIRIYLLSAAFVGCLLGLLIARTVYRTSDYLPVLLALFGAAGVYQTIPDPLSRPHEGAKPAPENRPTVALGLLHSLSRLVVIRVNLLAAALMVFARSEQRWTIGVTANLLALAVLLVIEAIRRPSG